ncbi:SIMPL domain-containing protein [Chloroflexota bacterium]
MKQKILLLVVALTLTVAVIGVSGCSQGSVPTEVKLVSQQEGIWVNGTGKIYAAPDVATLSLGIEAQQASVTEAQAQAAVAMEKVKAALKDNGVAEKDIQTRNFNIYKVTRWDRDKEQEEVTGYRVTNMVTAKVRQLDKVGAVIDAVAMAGGDLTRIDNISFSIDDMTAYYQQARQEAMADAKAKAVQMAELAGVKLGKPSYITENSYVPSPIYRQDMLEATAGAPKAETSISPGEMEITLNVQVAYAIAR